MKPDPFIFSVAIDDWLFVIFVVLGFGLAVVLFVRDTPRFRSWWMPENLLLEELRGTGLFTEEHLAAIALRIIHAKRPRLEARIIRLEHLSSTPARAATP